jgi:hypothetical protein
MARKILIDEFHLTVVAPRGLSPEEFRAMRRALGRVGFRAALGSAVRDVVHRHPSLARVRTVISR